MRAYLGRDNGAKLFAEQEYRDLRLNTTEDGSPDNAPRRKGNIFKCPAVLVRALVDKPVTPRAGPRLLLELVVNYSARFAVLLKLLPDILDLLST